jgi:UDP-2,4-diacetamido-2,4,6-trideoxy-beta-L-altropyranose hydrolase
VFRADASVRIGGGHVHRCLAIAEALGPHGFTCAFATIADSIAAVPALALAVVEVLTLPGDAAREAAAMRARWPQGAALLLVDHYERDIAFERSLKEWTQVLAVIDDLGTRPHAADLVIDPAPRSANAPGVLSGPAYAPLRPEWAQWREASLARDRARKLDRIVVSMGAVDAENVTTEVLRVLLRFELPCEIVAVLGSGAPNRAAVEALSRTDSRCRLVVEPAEFARLMAACDLAIGAAGSTSWERCCLGIPSIAIVIADNQLRNGTALETAGAAMTINNTAAGWQRHLADAVQSLIADPQRRRAMSQAAAALCDGRGAARIAEAVIERLNAA